jgi:hypothetical protein
MENSVGIELAGLSAGNTTKPVDSRLFAGVYPGDIVYADRYIEVAGDYKRLAFLAYDTLALSIEKDCPADLRARIVADAVTFQAKRGQRFSIDSSGSNFVVLGSALISPREREPNAGESISSTIGSDVI